ncbi:MAG TPA: hypothetical protein VNR89_23155 [Roseomonas sp.]|nr:hypothetical protein [Roseomonas sp.]
MLAALDARQPSPDDLGAALALARIVASELIGQHRLSEATYSDALRLGSKPTVVELVTLLGCFAMACWLMNAAHTPGAAICVDAAAHGSLW